MRILNSVIGITALAALVTTTTAQVVNWQLVKTNDSKNVIVSDSGTWILAAQDGVHRSTNSGATWSKVSFPSQGRPGFGVCAWGGIAANDHIFVNTVDDGIYLSTDDGLTWTSTGPVTSSFGTGSGSTAFNGTAVVAGYGGWPRGMYKWNGSGWTKTASGSDGYSPVATSNGWFFAAFMWSGGIYVSRDNGSSWSQVYTNSAQPCYLSGATMLAVAFDGKVYRTTNMGTNWAQVATLSGFDGLSGGQPTRLNASSAIVSGYGSGKYRTTWVTKDSGATWSQVWTNGAFDFTLTGNTVLASTDTGLYQATLGQVLGQPTLNIGKAIYLNSAELIVGSNYQVQVSLDYRNWTNYGPAFTATNSTWRATNYWDVENWNSLYFRLQQQ